MNLEEAIAAVLSATEKYVAELLRKGGEPECDSCRRTKAPVGRDIPMGAESGYCNNRNCPGYFKDPQPDHLWPDEMQAEFGYQGPTLEAVRAALRDALLVVHRQNCDKQKLLEFDYDGDDDLVPCGEGWDCDQAKAIKEALA